MKKRLLLSTLAAAAVAGAWFILRDHAAPASQAQNPPKVSVAPVMQRMLSARAEYTGRLQPVEYVQVRPRVSGYVESTHFVEGALLRKGQMLFQIDARPYRAEVKRLTADLAQARAELGLAQANAARARRLVEQRGISREEADRLITGEESAHARLAATGAALETAKLNLSFTQVRSPIEGRVSNVLVTAGNFVTSADVLTTVVSVDPVYAYFDVDERAYLRLVRQQGATPAKDPLGVRVAMALADEPDFPHPGRIDFVDNQLRTGTGSIRLRAVFDNQDGSYTPGLYVRLRLESGEPRPRLLIDDRAIGTDLGNKYVFVLDKDHKVAYRQVDIGPMFHGLRVVNTGLKAHDLVIVSGMQRVRAGAEVQPVRVAMTAWVSEADRLRLAETPESVAAHLASIDIKQ